MRIRRASMSAAGAFGLMLAGTSLCAAAQNCGTYGGYDPKAPSENVTVSAPRSQVEPSRLNTTIGRVSVSEAVRYADLNLCTESGAQELKARIRMAAQDVCKQIGGMYPHPMPGDWPCYRGAVDDAIQQANLRIDEARGLR